MRTGRILSKSLWGHRGFANATRIGRAVRDRLCTRASDCSATWHGTARSMGVDGTRRRRAAIRHPRQSTVPPSLRLIRITAFEPKIATMGVVTAVDVTVFQRQCWSYYGYMGCANFLVRPRLLSNKGLYLHSTRYLNKATCKLFRSDFFLFLGRLVLVSGNDREGGIWNSRLTWDMQSDRHTFPSAKITQSGTGRCHA
jgi:hypothetical protein